MGDCEDGDEHVQELVSRGVPEFLLADGDVLVDGVEELLARSSSPTAISVALEENCGRVVRSAMVPWPFRPYGVWGQSASSRERDPRARRKLA